MIGIGECEERLAHGDFKQVKPASSGSTKIKGFSNQPSIRLKTARNGTSCSYEPLAYKVI